MTQPPINSLQKPARQCWANALGGCDKLSREHVISQSILAAGCGCHPIIEGSNSVPTGQFAQSALTAKILCRKHNSQLSPLDAEVGRLSQILLSAAQGTTIGRPELSGALLERWALKTLINGLVAGWSDKRKWMPEANIVKGIFGQGVIPNGCGLYSLDGGSDDLTNPQHVSVSPYWGRPKGREKFLVGGLVRVHGLRLFVALDDSAVLRLIGRPEGPPRVYENDTMRFVYRPAFISVGAIGETANGIILKW